VIHSGAVIGADSLVLQVRIAHLKIPQIGNVVIEDNVDVKVLYQIDRATMGSTIIERVKVR
jgi:UDP-3-O-[3-hydroxymyristoyl] glucosamine N-acyltransferase